MTRGIGYDALGSDLFEPITELPDYYLTRVEYGLLQRHADEITDLIACERIAELDSGSGRNPHTADGLCRAPSGHLPSH